MIIAIERGDEDACHYADRFSATTSSPTEREPFTSTTSPGCSTSRSRSAASAARRHPVAAVGARELADRDHLLDARARAGAPRPRRGTPARRRRARPSRRAPRPAAARRALRQVRERRAHRHRVRVVAVVQEQAATGKRPLFLAQLRELDLRARPSGSGTSRLSATPPTRAACSAAGARRCTPSAKGSGAVAIDALDDDVGARSGTARAAARRARSRCRPAAARRAASAFARATFSSVPTSSRCTGPMFVITPMSGRANDASHAIWPSPRIASSADADLGVLLDAAERERHADLGVVVRLVRDRPPVRSAEREEDVLRRRLAGRAGDRRRSARVERARTSPAIAASAATGRSGTSAAAAPRASACWTKSAPPPTATKRSPSSIRRESICMPVTASAHGRATSRPSGSSNDELERDHERQHAPERLARDFPVVERDRAAGELHLRCRRPCPRSRRRRPARASPSAASIASPPVEHRPRATGAPAATSRCDRGRILGARVVGRDDRAVGELGARSCPSAAASRDRGRRLRRRRRSAGRRRGSRAARRTFSSESGVCA